MIPFGVTSSLFRGTALGAREISAVAASGFTSIDLVPAPGHLDLADRAQVAAITAAASAAGLAIGSVAVPLEDVAATLSIAHDNGWPVVVARLWPCRLLTSTAAIDPAALRLLFDKLANLLGPSRPELALQAPTPRLAAAPIAGLLGAIEDAPLNVCLDIGHAHLAGEAAEAAETLAGLAITTRLHDNNGREDLHRAPGAGNVDWPEALTACWKTGFTGPWVLDLAENLDGPSALARAVSARTLLQAILDDLAQPMEFPQ